MKTFEQFISEGRQNRLEVQDDTINYITSNDLKKYLSVVDKFLRPESKDVINWLIVNNSIEDLKSLPGAKNEDNYLAGFFNAGVPSKDNLKELYKAIAAVYKSGRIMEIPNFQTQVQFEAIRDQKTPLDSVVLDLTTEAGKNKVVKQYKPLVMKIAKQWIGKSTLSMDELYSAALEGLSWAMLLYGKKSKKRMKAETTMSAEEIEEYDKKLASSMSFGQYAAYMIRMGILESIKNESRTVRVPVSAQNKERKELGYNVRNNTVSGDKKVSHNGDDGSKTLFDFVGNAEDATKSIDNQDLQKLWKIVFKKLESKFDPKVMDVWYSFNGLNGYTKLKNKEIAKKYNVVPSNITYYLTKVNTYIRKDPKIFQAFADIYELMKECLNDEDRNDHDSEIIRPVVESPKTLDE